MRTLQITDHDLPTLEGRTPDDQAAYEILNGLNPAIVRRYLPNGAHEDRRVADLKLERVLRQFQLGSASTSASAANAK